MVIFDSCNMRIDDINTWLWAVCESCNNLVEKDKFEHHVFYFDILIDQCFHAIQFV